MCHEVVYGCSGVGFFQAFIEGATECIHNSNLLCEKIKKGRGKTMSGDATDQIKIAAGNLVMRE